MPLYRYKCQECGEVFKEIMRDRDKDVTCSGCNSANVDKFIPMFSTRYRGSGFYATDYNGSDIDEET